MIFVATFIIVLSFALDKRTPNLSEVVDDVADVR